jgi:hypothetical protein
MSFFCKTSIMNIVGHCLSMLCPGVGNAASARSRELAFAVLFGGDVCLGISVGKAIIRV